MMKHTLIDALQEDEDYRQPNMFGLNIDESTVGVRNLFAVGGSVTTNSIDSIQDRYAVTISISPYKKFDGKAYNKYDNSSQEKIILSLLEPYNSMFCLKERQFELTKKGNVHLHMWVTSKLSTLEIMQIEFKLLGGYKKDKDDQCFYFKSIFYLSGWEEYINKNNIINQ